MDDNPVRSESGVALPATPGLSEPASVDRTHRRTGPSSRRRRWAFRLAAVILGPSLFLVAIELVLRAAGYGYPTAFFLNEKIENIEVCVENIDFGRRFFPPGLERAPLPVVFEARKRPDAYRIFVLGESAAMGFPASHFSFARILETALAERFPDRRFEVVNTAMTAINSHVILQIARECAEYQPDLFVIYMGNNEVVGPYGASGVLGQSIPSVNLVRASVQLKSTRSGELISSLLRSGKGSSRRAAWNGMAMFTESEMTVDDPELQTVYSTFLRNLRDIALAARDSGAEVVVCTVASNLADSPPFRSVSMRDLRAGDRTRFERLVSHGVARHAAGDFAESVAALRDALEIDNRSAEVHFRLARSLLALQDAEQAKRHFLEARDRDTLRFRADSGINTAIHRFFEGNEDPHLHLADVVRAADEFSSQGIPGKELFYEHVHFTFTGNYLVARTVFEQVAPLIAAASGSPDEELRSPISEIECKRRLAYTEWSRFNALQALQQLYDRPPFSDQIGADQRLMETHTEIQKIAKQLEDSCFFDPVSVTRAALTAAPHDFTLRMDYGFLLMMRGDLDDALQQFHLLQWALPHHPSPRVLLAQVYLRQERIAEARAECQAALRLRPDWPQAVALLEALKNPR